MTGEINGSKAIFRFISCNYLLTMNLEETVIRGVNGRNCGKPNCLPRRAFPLYIGWTVVHSYTDIGNPKDIHPTNKQDVGKRLAAIALNKVYGKGNVFSGPVYQSMEINGNKIILSFNHIGSGLTTTDKYGYLKGFEVAGEDKVFRYAKAAIIGDKVVVYSNGVDMPKAVRYGWADDAGDCNLYNVEGFPAPPFRTDDWKGITNNEKYKISK